VEFTALFLIATIVMLIAWLGQRNLAAVLCILTLAACASTLLRHATDVLKLSF
jgi:hypothetical protein